MDEEDIVETITWICPYVKCGKKNIGYEAYGIADEYPCKFCKKCVKVRKE